MFASQAQDGTWRKGEPIFSSGEAVGSGSTSSSSYSSGTSTSSSSSSGTSTSTGSSVGENGTGAASSGKSRDIGNSYVFFFDIIEALMVSMGEKQPELLAPYLRYASVVLVCD